MEGATVDVVLGLDGFVVRAAEDGELRLALKTTVDVRPPRIRTRPSHSNT